MLLIGNRVLLTGSVIGTVHSRSFGRDSGRIREATL